MEMVGRHHDPFTVMQQFERPITVGMYSQPVTDITGTLLARATNPVSGADWLIFSVFRSPRWRPICSRAISPSRGPLRRSRRWRTCSLRFIWRTRPITLTSRKPNGCRCELLALWRRPRCGHSGRGCIPWARDARRDALELLWWIDRGRHHAGCRGRGTGSSCGRRTSARRTHWPSRSPARARRRRRVGVCVIRGTGCRGRPHDLRGSASRTLPLQREVVELSRSAVAHPLLGPSVQSLLECGWRPRRIARTAGQPRLGNRGARRA